MIPDMMIVANLDSFSCVLVKAELLRVTKEIRQYLQLIVGDKITVRSLSPECYCIFCY